MVNKRVGIRQEDMYERELRTPLVPQDAAELVKKDGIEVVVQTSSKRVFTDDDYRQLGIEVAEDLSSCPVIFGIKEIPVVALEREKTYVFFSHTIKGQAYNIPLLSRLLDFSCTLIDYEKVTDESNRRLIFFGNYAGLAGMIDTIWAFGKRLAWEGTPNPFAEIKCAPDYPDLTAAKEAIARVGDIIVKKGLPAVIAPLVVGITGYGNSSRGAQEILDILPVEEIAPEELAKLNKAQKLSNRVIYKVIFKEQDMVECLEKGCSFDLQEYYDHPERYRGIFEHYLPHLDILVNCIYWEPIYPRLVSKETVNELYREGKLRLKVIGDISCDVEGAIECTVKATEPGNPVYVYDPVTGQVTDGVAGNGPVIMAVGILPTEFPREASTYFSNVLKKYIPAITTADYTGEFAACQLPSEIKRAVIVYRGELTPDYRYLNKYLSQ